MDAAIERPQGHSQNGILVGLSSVDMQQFAICCKLDSGARRSSRDAAFERIGLSVFFESQSTSNSKEMVLGLYRSASLAERFRPCGSFFM
jgi:hypothetical protein